MPLAIPNSAPKPRAKRFARPPADTRIAMQLTERDLDILALVNRFRFLRAQHITGLIPGSAENVVKRLGLLFQAGYLERPLAQLEYYRPGGGSQPLAYALAHRGARALIDTARLDAGAVDWSRHKHNAQASRPFLMHTLAVAEFHVALAVALKSAPGLALIDTPELIQALPEPARSAENPLKLKVSVQASGAPPLDIGVVADTAFGLIQPDGRLYRFLVEVDKGTMPVERSSLTQTSILRKLVAYDSAKAQGLIERQTGWKSARVLIVTNTALRAENIRALIRRTRAIRAPALFLVTDQATLAADGILAHAWLDGTGVGHRLADVQPS